MTKRTKQFVIAAVTALAVPALSALAGEGTTGYECDNVCPLAQAANARRAEGSEASAVSPTLRATLAAAVARNLGRI